MDVQSIIAALFASPRRFFGIVALYAGSMLLIGWLLQSMVGLVPCALCIIQRFFFAGVGVSALLGWFLPRYSKVASSALLVLSLLGGGVALRNVYIQLVPQGLGAKCLPLLQSLTDWITVLFQATGDCSKRDWTLLGLSVPEWSLLSFVLLVVVSVWFVLLHERTQTDE